MLTSPVGGPTVSSSVGIQGRDVALAAGPRRAVGSGLSVAYRFRRRAGVKLWRLSGGGARRAADNCLNTARDHC
jgi:hypothetical protein